MTFNDYETPQKQFFITEYQRFLILQRLVKHDLELLNHTERVNPLTGKSQNSSKNVKKLIEEDMKREQGGYNNNNSSGLTIIDVQTLEVKNAMNTLL